MAPTAKMTSPTLRPPVNPYLEKQTHVTPARLESLWDDWHSQADKSSLSYSDSPSNDPSLSSSGKYTSRQPPLKSSTQVGTGKRWGLLKTKPKLDETSMNVAKDTKTRENQENPMFIKQKAGSGRNPMKLIKKARQKTPDGIRASSMQASHSLALPRTPRTPRTPITPQKAMTPNRFESNDSAIYFTVDPNWDASKGDTADVFLLTDVPTYTSPPVEISKKTTSVVAVSQPVKNNDRERSFLILE